MAAGASHDISVEEVIALIAKRKQWPLDTEAARALLEKFGPVTQEQPMPTELSSRGGPSGVVQRAEVSYTRDEKRRWSFDSAGFFFDGQDLNELQLRLQALLVKQLGKPEWTEKDDSDSLPSSRWALGGPLTLFFAPSPNGGEHLLMIAISEPEGEAE